MTSLNDNCNASGVYYDEAMQHLREQLHLETLLDQSPIVQQLGRRIREFLLRPFKDSAEKRGAEWVDTIAEAGVRVDEEDVEDA